MSSFVDLSHNVQRRLQALIEGDGRGWTYAIFWQLSRADHAPLLGRGDGYFEGETNKENKNPFSSSSPNYAEQQYRKRVLAELNCLITDSVEDSIDEEVTDPEWFFLISMTQSFHDKTALPGRALHTSGPLWITGANWIANCHCERARQAREFGLQTLVLIRTANGVIELGSTAFIIHGFEFDLLANIWFLFDGDGGGSNIGLDLGFGPVQYENESESSNSVGNNSVTSQIPCLQLRKEVPDSSDFGSGVGPWNAGVQSNHLFASNKKRGLSLGSNFNHCHCKPETESTSQDSVGNYPIVKRKLLFSNNSQFKGDSDSDQSDINAFIRILRHR